MTIQVGKGVIVMRPLKTRSRYERRKEWPGIVVGYTETQHRVLFVDDDGTIRKRTTHLLYPMDIFEAGDHDQALQRLRAAAREAAK